MTNPDVLDRLQDAYDRTGELDWELVGPDSEIHDHELLDSAVHRGRDGWNAWSADWQQAFEDYSLERLDQVEDARGRGATSVASAKTANATETAST